MNDDDLKRLWQEQKVGGQSGLPAAEQIALMRRKMRKFQRTILWRDLREVAACLLVVVFFGRALLHAQPALAQAGCWILILSAIFISCNLVLARRRSPVPEPTGSLADSLKCEIRKVDTQIRLLRSVLWWYVLPIMIGANLFFIGHNRSASADIAYFVFTVVLSAFVYWLNLRAVKRQLEPMKAELESLLDVPQ